MTTNDELTKSAPTLANTMLSAAELSADDAEYNKLYVKSQIEIALNFRNISQSDRLDAILKVFDETYFEKNRVAKILQDWIVRHEIFTREKPYIKYRDGTSKSLNSILSEIEDYTDFGRNFVDNIISTAIGLIVNDIEKMSK
jgi:hypothetical protein